MKCPIIIHDKHGPFTVPRKCDTELLSIDYDNPDGWLECPGCGATWGDGEGPEE